MWFSFRLYYSLISHVSHLINAETRKLTNKMFLIFLLFFLISNNLVNCEQNQCINKEKCSECLQELGCSWCSKFELNNKPHCFKEENIAANCPQINIVSAKTKPLILVENEPLQLKGGPNKKTIQIRPQVVNLTLRRGEEFKLKFQISLAHNTPIDLYYLMDLSASMKPYKENLANLGLSLVNAMRKTTSDFQLGFGSFVDKVAMPFASTHPERLKNPCTDKAPCAPAYSFINHLNISKGENFAELVNSTLVSGNVDSPEGGLDALMQVMVCNERIGWRNNSRRIIVFSTDAAYHIAGDGKLAGIVEPNDASCHMEGNKYTHSLIYDYPSISLVRHIAKTRNFNIFFMIVENKKVLRLYDVLSSQIDNSKVEKLNKNSNITKLITLFNKNLQSTFTVRDENSEGVEIKYFSSCKNGYECVNVTRGEKLLFEADIKATSCNKPQQAIYIKSDAFDEYLLVNLEIICDCDCEHENNKLSDDCNRNGQEQCGICVCNEGFIGKTCECKQDEYYSGSNKTCVNGNDSEVCSGMGQCKCGVCECEKRTNPEEIISGKFCECDNYSCLKSADQKLCSGNGICQCGKCSCFSGWTDESCSCSTKNDLCWHNGALCNNKGECSCGKCNCKMGYFGQYCEDCPTCSKCEDLKSCIECQILELADKSICGECDISVRKVEIIEDIDDDEIKVCRFPSKDDCILIFKYNYNNLSIIEAESTLRCSKPVNVLALVTGLIGGILLIGILTLIIWKIYTAITDRREVAKFLIDKEGTTWHNESNPLFKPAVTTFNNPTYGRKSLITKRKTVEEPKE